MKLYHFTSFGHVPHILSHGGLQNGDVMCGDHGEQTRRATWLTSDPSPIRAGGVSVGGLMPLPDDFKKKLGKSWTQTTDKRVVRISVMIPTTNRQLKHWLTWAKSRLGQKLVEMQIDIAGGKAEAEKYYFYEPLIRTEDFLSIELLHEPDRVYRVATKEQLSSLIPHEIGLVGKVDPAPRDN